MRTHAEASSITLSSPNAVSVRLPAITPAAIATTPSTTIHATVSHSRRNAARISAARCGVRNDAEELGPQQVSAQLSGTLTFAALASAILAEFFPIAWFANMGHLLRRRCIAR